MSYTIEPGSVFGELIVIECLDTREHGYKQYLCVCTCGKEVIVRSSHLTSGHTKSCGCLVRNNWLGYTFKTFTVVEKLNEYTASRQRLWKIQCTCGYTTKANSTQLASYSKSRGNRSYRCPECEAKTYVHESMFNYYLNQYKMGAKTRGYCFELSNEQVQSLMVQDCVYCGSPPSVRSVGTRTKYPLVCNGLDRVNNNEGYTVENTVSCCVNCNYAKKALTADQYINHCKKVVEYQRIA